ncbi:MAG TPA: protein kinase, partial [Polyangiaceae bacterium]|nr:protein kinase [Polyangiaceae bacterium]
SRQIGAGAMGVVYEAFDAERNRRVAIKTLNHLEPEALYRLKNEFRSLAGVTHPNLVQMHELLAVDGQWFFVMDHVDGTTFTEHFQRLANRPEGRDARFYARLLEALGELVQGVAALHELGKIHRDLKPSNVLVDGAGRVIILDFGLSSDALPPADQSGAGWPCGTPLYMAPETFAGEPQGPAADWYAVGLILYEVLVGQLPYGGQSHQLISLKLFTRPDPPRSIEPKTPEALNQICVRLLQRDPALRPGAKELGALFPAAHRERSSVSTRRSRARPLVGREKELAQLRGAFQNVVASRTAVISISGPSGIGKTALVEAFLQELRDQDDVKVFCGRCYEQEAVPYKAFDQLVDGMSRYLSHTTETAAALAMPREPGALAALFPVLARVPVIRASARPLPRDRTEQRRLGFVAFRETLCRIADRQKLVLFVDDVQWSDPDSALLFKHVWSGRLPPACLLVCCSRLPRPPALEGLVSSLEEERGEHVDYDEIHLEALSEGESIELARQSGLEGSAWQRAARSISEEAKG